MNRALFLRVLTLTLIVSNLRAKSRGLPGKPDQQPASVWVEAEDALKSSFIPGKTVNVSPTGNGCSGGYALKLEVGTNKVKAGQLPFFCEYEFEVKKGGVYHWWVAGSPQHVGWISPVYVQLDKREFISLKDKPLVSSLYGVDAQKFYGWFKVGEFDLKPGRHHVRFEVRNLRAMDANYMAYLDAFFLTTDATFVPQGNRPKYSPQPAWNEQLQGSSFEEYVKKLELPLYVSDIAKTQEKIGPDSAREVLDKIRRRPLPDGTLREPGPHEFGVHGMETPFVQAGKDTNKIKLAYELLARVGVQSFRTAEACWHRLGDNFDHFEELDFQVANASRYGMGHLFTVGYPAYKYSISGLSAVQPQYEDRYREYLRAILSRYKGGKGVRYVELANEVDAPDVWWKGSTPEMYVREMKMLKEEAAKIDPMIKTVAFASTYSRNELMGGANGGRRFVRRCFALGIDKYADAYSLHYTWTLAAKDFPAFFRREMSKAGSPNKPLLNTEETGAGKPAEVIKLFARDFFLYDMKLVDYFLAKDIYENGQLHYFGLFDRDWAPKLRLLAYAAAVDAMQYRELVGMAEPAPGIEAYVLKYADGYKKDGAPYSIVMWKGGADAVESTSPGHVGKTFALSRVGGCQAVVAAFQWNLDAIKWEAKAPIFQVGDEPIAVFANQLPKWKLISPAEWLALQLEQKPDRAPMMPGQ